MWLRLEFLNFFICTFASETHESLTNFRVIFMQYSQVQYDTELENEKMFAFLNLRAVY